ncbi:MAG: CPBP family intramembrane metalloprotease [bacterium]|nr:CPBP family intramembrane metalloprotease [bacterium]
MVTQMEKKSKGKMFLSVLGCLVPMLIFWGVQMVIGVIAGIVIVVATIVQNSSFQTATQLEDLMYQNIAQSMPYLLLASTLSTTIIGFIWYRKKYKKRYDYSLKEVAKAKDYIYIVLTALAASFSIDLIILLVAAIFPHALSNYENLMDAAGIGSSAIAFLTAAFLAPIGEECIFRGVIQRKAEKFMPFVLANLLQAFLFGVMHWNIVQSSYAFVLGLILGYIRHKYQTVRMSVLFHMVFNIIGQTVPMLTADLSDTVNLIIALASIPFMAYILKLISQVDIPAKPYIEPQPQMAYGYGQPME